MREDHSADDHMLMGCRLINKQWSGMEGYIKESGSKRRNARVEGRREVRSVELLSVVSFRYCYLEA
jgi:hypothetical protein